MQTKSGNERMQERRRGNVLNYEGNICKQVIEALGRRLDKWRTVLLLFKRTPTCEWIFCSQKVARVSQDFHSRGRRLSLNRWGSNITIEARRRRPQMIRSEEIGKERKKRTRKIVDFNSFVRFFLKWNMGIFYVGRVKTEHALILSAFGTGTEVYLRTINKPR